MKTNFIGRLATDATVNTLQNGTKVTHLRMFVTVKKKDSDGSYKSIVIDGSVWGKLGECVASYKKGQRVYCYATVDDVLINQGNDGKNYLNYQVTVDDVEFIEKRENTATAAQPAATAQQQMSYNGGMPQQNMGMMNGMPQTNMMPGMGMPPQAGAMPTGFAMPTAQMGGAMPQQAMSNKMFENLF